jgi:serine/threonine protein kinase
MIDIDFYVDFPSEPHGSVPRVSILGEQSPSRRNHYQREIEILKPLNKAKFSVYLAAYKNSQEHFAAKVFPLEEESAQVYFKNEIRFSALEHPNVVRTIEIHPDILVSHGDTSKRVSCILTEFAPFGDSFQFISKHHKNLSETFLRTFFRDLIEGLEYIHSQNVAHLDLKLENMLVGEDCRLKIADFDLSCHIRDNQVKTKGSRCFRAPEMINQKCRDPSAADIYSAGIILFVMKCGGILPHTEEMLLKDINLYKLLYSNNPEFWRMHCMIQKKAPSFFTPEFKELFLGMTEIDDTERFTIADIKNSAWYNGSTLSNKEMKDYIKNLPSSN